MPAITTALVLIALLVPASGALASQVTYSGSTLTYTAAPGEGNTPIVSVNEWEILCDPVPAPCLSIFDPGVRISFPAGSCAGGPDDVRCVMPDYVVASLGDREDSYYDWDGDSSVDAGSGDDNTITGNGGNDTLTGGIGRDVLIGGPGDDTLDGGPGDDFLEGIAYPGEAETLGTDTYASGGGSDILTYEGRGDDLELSPDGAANDGAPGEGDDIGADIAVIVGGHGADTMVGNSGANVFEGRDGDDLLFGAGGDDRLSGGKGNDGVSSGDGQDVLGGDSGDDVLDGGPGMDAYWGDEIGACIPALCASGQDLILARDGAQEDVNCGPGTDQAEVDPNDNVVAELSHRCENIDGAAAPTGQPGTVDDGASRAGTGRAVTDEQVKIPLHFTAPGAGVISVRATARADGERVAAGRASRRTRRRGRVKLALKLSRLAMPTLNAKGELRLSLKASFRPRGRPTYVLARRTVTVRDS